LTSNASMTTTTTADCRKRLGPVGASSRHLLVGRARLPGSRHLLARALLPGSRHLVGRARLPGRRGRSSPQVTRGTPLLAPSLCSRAAGSQLEAGMRPAAHLRRSSIRTWSRYKAAAAAGSVPPAAQDERTRRHPISRRMLHASHGACPLAHCCTPACTPPLRAGPAADSAPASCTSCTCIQSTAQSTCPSQCLHPPCKRQQGGSRIAQPVCKAPGSCEVPRSLGPRSIQD
jgi:hypothetical protein